MGTIGGILLDAIYPPDTACWACGREAVLNAGQLCAACAPHARVVGEIAPPPAGLDGAWAGLLYTDALQPALYGYKYGEAQYLAAPLATFLQLPAGCTPDALVPVPLHKARLRERGFNQSELLAAQLSRRTGIALENGWLMRERETQPQASLPRNARTTNMQDAFRAAPAVRGTCILLIDDLLTSGSTLGACAAALRRAGARQVYASCIFTAREAH